MNICNAVNKKTLLDVLTSIELNNKPTHFVNEKLRRYVTNNFSEYVKFEVINQLNEEYELWMF